MSILEQSCCSHGESRISLSNLEKKEMFLTHRTPDWFKCLPYTHPPTIPSPSFRSVPLATRIIPDIHTRNRCIDHHTITIFTSDTYNIDMNMSHVSIINNKHSHHCRRRQQKNILKWRNINNNVVCAGVRAPATVSQKNRIIKVNVTPETCVTKYHFIISLCNEDDGQRRWHTGERPTQKIFILHTLYTILHTRTYIMPDRIK